MAFYVYTSWIIFLKYWFQSGNLDITLYILTYKLTKDDFQYCRWQAAYVSYDWNVESIILYYCTTIYLLHIISKTLTYIFCLSRS